MSILQKTLIDCTCPKQFFLLCWLDLLLLTFFFFFWIFSCFILGMKTSKKDIFFVFDVFLLQYGPCIPYIIYTHYSLLHHSSLYLILFVFLVVSNSSTENIALGMFPSSRPALVCFKDVSLLHLIVQDLCWCNSFLHSSIFFTF